MTFIFVLTAHELAKCIHRKLNAADFKCNHMGKYTKCKCTILNKFFKEYIETSTSVLVRLTFLCLHGHALIYRLLISPKNLPIHSNAMKSSSRQVLVVVIKQSVCQIQRPEKCW